MRTSLSRIRTLVTEVMRVLTGDEELLIVGFDVRIAG
jgi:hypothetical protein